MSRDLSSFLLQIKNKCELHSFSLHYQLGIMAEPQFDDLDTTNDNGEREELVKYVESNFFVVISIRGLIVN